MNEVLPRVGLMQTEDRRLFSHQIGIEYQLAVWLPESYTTSGQRYPVIYVLDGDLVFGMATALLPAMSLIDRVPQMIIVGIGYNRSFAEWAKLRELDFKIPEVQDDPPDSHADRFLAAMKHEIIPFIEANYRTDPGERTLYGYSSSGFFAVYTLVNQPDLFRRYLAGSPDTDLSCPYLQAHDQKLASHESTLPIDLFLTVGDLENGAMQSSLVKFNELVATIQARNYPGLRMDTQIYSGENHGAVGIALTFINGLRKFYTPAKP
jgi:predicted alpha/beta superfamily hydrolase